MISPVNSSASAITAAFRKQSVSAHNTANINTDGFKSLIASTVDHKNGSVTLEVRENPEPGIAYFKRDGTEAETSNVNLASEAVEQVTARTMLAANVAALKTYEEMQERLIDLMA
jgi:flagellar basal-body rod protein FlgC